MLPLPNTQTSPLMTQRCTWAASDPLLAAYHDAEWGVPVRDSRALWEMLMLEGAQAGLSWLTVLRRRDSYRIAFAGFDPAVVAGFTGADVERLMGDAGIIRARAKILAVIGNAKAYLAMQAAGEDLAEFVWGMAGGAPIQNTGPVPAKTALSESVSKALKARGFKFVGPVIVYAWLQAIGVVNDHAPACFRRRPVAALA